MQTHDDRDAKLLAQEWLESLKEKAGRMESERLSEITSGKAGEGVLDEWDAKGVHVRRLPDDEHGILRISIGGGDKTPAPVNYCVFRGDPQECRALLRRALRALESGLNR